VLPKLAVLQEVVGWTAEAGALGHSTTPGISLIWADGVERLALCSQWKATSTDTAPRDAIARCAAPSPSGAKKTCSRARRLS
jgi:hypothetical protein